MGKPRTSKPVTDGGDPLPRDVKPQELAERLADPEYRQRIETAIGNLPPEKAAELVALLEASIRRRKTELIGYVAAALVLLVGMVIALYLYGASPGQRFRGWFLLLPLAAAGGVMIAVARMAQRREKEARAASRATSTKVG